jgi:hypothetical protein
MPAYRTHLSCFKLSILKKTFIPTKAKGQREAYCTMGCRLPVVNAKGLQNPEGMGQGYGYKILNPPQTLTLREG